MVHPDDGGRDNREIKKVLMILKCNESQISNIGAAQNSATKKNWTLQYFKIFY